MWRSPRFPPLKMEDYFDTTYRDGPAVHLGSRTLDRFKNSAEEQAYEAVHLAYTKPGDTIILRNADPTYLDYWHALVPDVHILNHVDYQPSQFLSDVVLESPGVLPWLQANKPDEAKLFVFFSTAKELQIAKDLRIPLYGSPAVSERFGTKSGVRRLAEKARKQGAQVQMPRGHICETSDQIRARMLDLLADKTCQYIILKNDESIGGAGSERVTKAQARDMSPGFFETLLRAIGFVPGIPVVVEEWIEDVLAPVSVHLEIPLVGTPTIRSGWQQLIDEKDKKSYRGAQPLMLPSHAIRLLNDRVQQLATVLQKEGAIGSYAPNFLITTQLEIILLELNARIPLSAFALSIIQQIKDIIGDGFITHYVDVPGKWSFAHVKQVLKNADILIERPEGERTWGVVPFNVGLLPHGKCSLVAIAPTWQDARQIMAYAVKLLSQS